MGLGPAAVKLYLELWQRGIFKDLRSVADMGSQELHLTKKSFDGLVRSAGIKNYDENKFRALENWPGAPRLSAKAFYEMLGLEKYTSVDINGVYGSIKHDLNLPLEDKSLYGKYDLVTDHGTNEHVFNVAEAYRTMHRLCRKGGIMIISQMVTKGNGYFLFDLSFFEGISAANNYRILFSSYVVMVEDKDEVMKQFHIPLSRELLDVINYASVKEIGITYVLQKQSDDDFKYAYQSDYLSKVNNNIGYQLQFLPDPPSRAYIPLFPEYLRNVKIEFLLQLLARKVSGRFQRVFKKIKR